MISISTARFTYNISAEGKNLSFIDKRTGIDYIADSYCAVLSDKRKKEYYPVNAAFDGSLLTVRFSNNLKAAIRVKTHSDYVTFTLEKVDSEDFFAIAFVNIAVNIAYDRYLFETPDTAFTASLMGMTVSTRMAEHPGRNTLLRAEAYPHIGLFATKRSPYPAKAAVIGAPDSEVRKIMKQVLQEIPDGELPKSTKGGPYALDCKDARRTYTTLFNVKPNEVDAVVARLKRLGITQVSIHQGIPYRQGDFEVNRELFPGGIADFKALIARFHHYGIQVGLHPYTFFLAHESKYLTPIPHEDLDFICELTLAEAIDADAKTIPFNESPEVVAEIYNYSLVSSPYVKIGQELIRFGGLKKTYPYAFTDCQRGALGTKNCAHSAGEKMRQLKEYFCYVAPRADSALFYEIARNTAEFFNACDFDMIYLDAIDGVFCLDGNDYAWYHAMAFISEMFKYLKKAPIFDCCYNPQYTASWYARSRYGALDSGNRGYIPYIDAHINYNNKTAERMYLPPELGWWDLYNAKAKYGTQAKMMTGEEVEYLGCKIIATDCCMSYRDDSVLNDIPLLTRYAETLKLYDNARRDGRISAKMKRLLREPGREFKLVQNENGYVFLNAVNQRFRADSFNDARNVFYMRNRFAVQEPTVRLEALCAADDYDTPGAVILKEFDENATIPNDALYILDTVKPIDAKGNTAVGIWLYGDGSETMVRIQLFNRLKDKPKNQLDYYIKADFRGWRYFAFVEGQNAEPAIRDWPRTELVYQVFSDVKQFYGAYRSPVDFSAISFLRITTNATAPTAIRLRTIKLLPCRENTLVNPSVIINGSALTFNTKLHCFNVLEWAPGKECVVFDYLGNIIAHPTVSGKIGSLINNYYNEIKITSEDLPAFEKRVALTLGLIGGPALEDKAKETVVTRQDISAAVKRLGLTEGDIVLVHSAFSTLGKVEGGAQAVIDGFIDVLGKSGTLVMPALIQKDFAHAYQTWYLNKPGDVGYLAEYFRKLPGTLRSDQPTHSLTARGALAYELTSEHMAYGPRLSPFGEYAFSESSPWQKMLDKGGKVVFLGINMRKNTYKHLIESQFTTYLLAQVKDEEKRRVLDARIKRYGDQGIWLYYDSEKMQSVLDKAGLIKKTKCGRAELLCLKIKEMVAKSLAELLRSPEKWYSDAKLAWINDCIAAAK